MLSLLIAAAISFNPVIIVPPMFGSVLMGNIKNLDSHWYCPRNYKEKWLWHNDEFMLGPLENCLSEYITCAFDSSLNHTTSRPEAEIWTIDFGGDGAIRFLDPGLFGYHKMVSMDTILNRFTDLGYVIHKDILGAPYDWRMNPVALQSYWPLLKALVEEAYEKNENKKVRLFGYSAGCIAAQYFLTRTGLTQDWKDKYLDFILMVGPSYAGSSDSMMVIWDGGASWSPAGRSDSADTMVLSLPMTYTHLPNYYSYGDHPIITGPGGEEIKASGFKDFLYKHGKIREEFKPIYEEALDVLDHDVEEIGISAYFLFNTVLPTVIGMDFPNGYDKPYNLSVVEGDMVITKIALFYGCTHWKKSESLFCHDIQVQNTSYNHGTMISQPEVVDLIVKTLHDDSWKVPGVHNITGLEFAGKKRRH